MSNSTAFILHTYAGVLFELMYENENEFSALDSRPICFNQAHTSILFHFAIQSCPLLLIITRDLLRNGK